MKFSEFINKLNESESYAIPANWPEDGIDDLENELHDAGERGKDWDLRYSTKGGGPSHVVLKKPTSQLQSIVKSFRLKKTV
jgi:hypothetical protein